MIFKELCGRPTTTADFRSHFDKFPTSATFACWKTKFKTEVCTCSQFLTEALQWIKEVELVDSVDDLICLSSTSGVPMPNFEVLDARIASALNRIIHNTKFKRKASLEEQKARKQDSFFRGRVIASLIYEYFRVIGANDLVKNCVVSIMRYEIIILVPEMEIATPCPRIMEENSMYEEFLERKQRSRGDTCIFRHDINQRGKMTQSNTFPNSFMQQNERKASRTGSPRGRSPSGRTSRWPCKDNLRGTCNNSFCEKWHLPESLFYKTKSGCQLWEKCSYAHRQVDEQPSKRIHKNDDKSTVDIPKKGDWHESVRHLFSAMVKVSFFFGTRVN